jgi:hypothetical protein
MVWGNAKKKSENSCGSVKINAQWPAGCCAFILFVGRQVKLARKAACQRITRPICAASAETNRLGMKFAFYFIGKVGFSARSQNYAGKG